MVYFAKWKISLILAVCLFGVAFAAPNLVSRTTLDSLPSWLPNQQVNLGLDLRGGSHLLLEVDVKAVIDERLGSIVDSIRPALIKERIRYSGLGITNGSVHVTITKPEERENAYNIVRKVDSGVTSEIDENGTIQLHLTEKAIKERTSSAVEQSIEIVRRRIDETGTREPTIQRQGEDRILVQLPGVDDPERIKSLLGKTAKMSFHLVDNSVSGEDLMRGRVPPSSKILPSQDKAAGATKYAVRKRVEVSGENLVDAQPTLQDGRPVVSFTFDGIGGRKFGEVTGKNVGTQLAIVLDGQVISAPRIQSQIFSNGVITGNFTTEEARDLAILLRAGALPAPLTILEERSVGPGLGADSIAAGKIASIVGLIAVVLFMGITYSRFGWYADVALMFNIVFIIGALSALQATLTLPGIAGIVLTIGMAVDANVLIFERIREETRKGMGPIGAIESGYKHAITTIVDANVTTLIAALLLFQFGSGPVKGFAVTLAIGIVTSMFTAIMLTRLFVATWARRSRPKTLEM